VTLKKTILVTSVDPVASEEEEEEEEKEEEEEAGPRMQTTEQWVVPEKVQKSQMKKKQKR
jgi:hypothetical protein